MPKPEGLTTTSYAILGHLAMQPWTMYDLAAQMRRNVLRFTCAERSEASGASACSAEVSINSLRSTAQTNIARLMSKHAIKPVKDHQIRQTQII